MRVFLLLIFFMLSIVGCSSKNVSPATVTKDFWIAQKQERVKEASKLTISGDIKKTKLYEKIKIKAVDIKEVQEDKNRASVPTILYLKGDKDIGEVEFLTELNRTDKGWRVNMTDTKRNLYFAISKQVGGNLGTILKSGLEGLESFKEIFGDFIEQFKRVIEKEQGE